jgi:uncharacterized protein YkwD
MHLADTGYRCRLGQISGLPVALAFALICGAGCGDDADGVCAKDRSADERELGRLVDEQRQTAGLPAYRADDALDCAARMHAKDMARNDYFSHESQDGRTFADRARSAGYDGTPLGENIAQSSTPASVVAMWMDSDGHRANLLSQDANEIGVGNDGDLWVVVIGRE